MGEPKYLDGLVVGRQGKLADVWVESLQRVLRCHTRRQHLQVVCGDKVCISVSGSPDQESNSAISNKTQEVRREDQRKESGVVEQCLERENVFFRRDVLRTKTIAANVDQILGILAWDPLPNESLLMRWMAVASAQKTEFIMVVNKQDLAQYCPEEHPLWEWITRYRALGIKVVELSASEATIDPILPYLKGKFSLLIGQSGSGKSSLVNALIPGLALSTQLLSEAIGQGKHTTTTTQLYWLGEDKRSAIIDSPGMQTFGITGLSKEALLHSCPDFVPYLGKCRFRNCTHGSKETGCALNEAVETERIHPDRWAIAQELLDEIEC